MFGETRKRFRSVATANQLQSVYPDICNQSYRSLMSVDNSWNAIPKHHSSYSVRQMQNNVKILMETSPYFPRRIFRKYTQGLQAPIVVTWCRKQVFHEFHLVVLGKLAWKMSIYESKATLRWNLTFCCTNTNLLTVSCSSVVSGVTSLPNIPDKCTKVHHFI